MTIDDAIAKKKEAVKILNAKIDRLIAEIQTLKVNENMTVQGLRDKQARAIAVSLEVRRLSNNEIYSVYDYYTIELQEYHNADRERAEAFQKRIDGERP